MTFAIQSDSEYKIIVKQQEKIAARLYVRIVNKDQFAIRVALNPLFSRAVKKQIEPLLPITQEKLIPVKNMTETICRYLWILCHTN